MMGHFVPLRITSRLARGMICLHALQVVATFLINACVAKTQPWRGCKPDQATEGHCLRGTVDRVSHLLH